MASTRSTFLDFAVLALCVITQLGCAMVGSAASPDGLWRLDEAKGDTAREASGNGPDGTIVGAKWTRGVSGAALEFSGADHHVDIITDDDAARDEFTISFWAKWRGGNGQMPIETLDSAGNTTGYVFFVSGSFCVNFAGDKEFYPDNEALAADKWALYTVTHSAGTVTLYVDGSPVSTDQRTYQIHGSFRLGRSADPYKYLGDIDELAVHYRALSADEVRASFDAMRDKLAQAEEDPDARKVALPDGLGGAEDGAWSVRVTVTSDLAFPRVPMDPKISFGGMPGRLDPNSIEVIDVATGEAVASAIEDFQYGDTGRVEWVIENPTHREYEIRFRTMKQRPALVPRKYTPRIGVGDLLRYNAGEPRPITPIYLTGLVDVDQDGKRDLLGMWNYAHRPGDAWSGPVYYPRVGSVDEFRFGEMVRLPGLPAAVYATFAAGDVNADGLVDLVRTKRGAASVGLHLNTGNVTEGGIPTFSRAGTTPAQGGDWMPIRVVDLDADGAWDLTLGKWRVYNEGAETGALGEGAESAIYIRNTNADGWPFSAADAAALSTGGVGTDFLDIDGDGRLDAVSLVPTASEPGLSGFEIGWQKNLGGTPPEFGDVELLGEINAQAWRPTQIAAVRTPPRQGLLVTTRDYQRVMFFELLTPDDDGARFRLFGTAQSDAAIMSLSDQAAPFVCDWEGDGDQDLLVGGGYGWPRIAINEGDDEHPAFAEAQLIMSGGKPIRLLRDEILGPPACWHNMGYTFPAYVDWDADGLPDLILPNETNRILWYKNIGTRQAPEFGEQRQIIADGYPDSPQLRTATAELVAGHAHVYPPDESQPFYWRSGCGFADFDRDGLIDMVARNWSKYSFGLFMQYRGEDGALRLKRQHNLSVSGGGTFHGTRPNAIDWDGDGLLDIVYARATNDPTADTIFIARNIGTNEEPIFEAERPLRFFGEPIYITRHGPHPWAGDFDGDGRPDLLCYTEWSVYPFYTHAAIEMPQRPEFTLGQPQRAPVQAREEP